MAGKTTSNHTAIRVQVLLDLAVNTSAIISEAVFDSMVRILLICRDIAVVVLGLP